MIFDLSTFTVIVYSIKAQQWLSHCSQFTYMNGPGIKVKHQERIYSENLTFSTIQKYSDTYF